MSSATTYLAAAAAVGAASEATGTTAFTPLGERARAGELVDGGGGGGGPSTASLLAAMQGAGEPGGTSIDLDLGGLAEQGGQGDALADLATSFAEQQASTIEMLEEGRRRAEEEREKAEDRAEERDPRDGPLWQLVERRYQELEDGLEDTQSTFEEWREEQEEKAKDASDGFMPDVGLPGVPTFDGGNLDLDTGATDFFVRTGMTYAEAAKALYGGEYSPEGTLAEDALGPETRRIDWSKYQLTDAPSLEERIESVDLPGDGETFNDEGPTLEERAIENLKSKLPGSSSDSSSSTTRKSSTVSTDDERQSAPVNPRGPRGPTLPDELEDRLEAPTDLPAGGL